MADQTKAYSTLPPYLDMVGDYSQMIQGQAAFDDGSLFPQHPPCAILRSPDCRDGRIVGRLKIFLRGLVWTTYRRASAEISDSFIKLPIHFVETLLLPVN